MIYQMEYGCKSYLNNLWCFFVILPIQSDVELRVMLLIFILLSECTSTLCQKIRLYQTFPVYS